MDVLDAIHQRRAVRSFRGLSVTHGTVNELLEAAVQATSAMNKQP